MGEASDANTLAVSSQLKAAPVNAQHMGEASAASTMAVSSQLEAVQGTAQHTEEASHASTLVASSQHHGVCKRYEPDAEWLVEAKMIAQRFLEKSISPDWDDHRDYFGKSNLRCAASVYNKTIFLQHHQNCRDTTGASHYLLTKI